MKALLLIPCLNAVLFCVSCDPKPEIKLSEEEECLRSATDTWREYPLLAIHNLTRAIQLNPKLSAAYKQRAFALERVGNLDAADADLNKVIELQGETSEIQRLWSEIFRRRGDLAASKVHLDRAIELNPLDAYNHSMRAEALKETGEFEGAEKSYSRAIELGDRDNIGLYHGRRAWLRERLGDLDGALSDYTAVLRHHGPNTFYIAEPNFRRGSIFFSQGSYRAALEDFRAASARCRDGMELPAALHIWLARSMAGERDQADRELSKFLEMNEQDLGTRRGFIDFLLGRLSEKAFLSEHVTHTQADSQFEYWGSWFYAGMKRVLDGDLSGGAELLQRVIDLPPKDYPPSEYLWARTEFRRIKK